MPGVGGYSTRTNKPEIDLVVGDRAPIAKRVTALDGRLALAQRPMPGLGVLGW